MLLEGVLQSKYFTWNKIFGSLNTEYPKERRWQDTVCQYVHMMKQLHMAEKVC